MSTEGPRVNASASDEFRAYLRDKYRDTVLAGLGMMHEDDAVAVIVAAVNNRLSLRHAVLNALTALYTEEVYGEKLDGPFDDL